MPKLAAGLIALIVLLTPRPSQAEPVYDFVVHCRAQSLGMCFHLISERLSRLDHADPQQRVCLPRFFGATMVDSGVIPVSVLEYVRLRLSAARFGDAGTDVEVVMARIVRTIYSCER